MNSLLFDYEAPTIRLLFKALRETTRFYIRENLIKKTFLIDVIRIISLNLILLYFISKLRRIRLINVSYTDSIRINLKKYSKCIELSIIFRL